MSEDSDDARYAEPTSLVSPHRHHRPLTNLSSPISFTLNHPSHGRYAVTAIGSSEPRQRNSDSEGRIPLSQSDICHSADLRRAALLRSLQMRAQPLAQSSFELPAQEPIQIMEAEELPFSCATKSPVDESDESEFLSSQEVPHLFIEDSSRECEVRREKGCRVVDVDANLKQ